MTAELKAAIGLHFNIAAEIFKSFIDQMRMEATDVHNFTGAHVVLRRSYLPRTKGYLAMDTKWRAAVTLELKKRAKQTNVLEPRLHES